MKVRELIKQLVDLDMEEEVYIGLGFSIIPDGMSGIMKVSDFSNVYPTFGNLGIYLIPHDNLQKDES